MELSLLIPFISVMIVGSIDLGRGVWAKHSLEHVVAEAVRRAAVSGATNDVPESSESLKSWVKGELPFLAEDALTVVTTWNPNNRPGSQVTVSVIYDFEPITPLLPFESLALSAAASSVISY